MGMSGRQYNTSKYRYGFNGKENDNEVKGEGNQQDYGFRIYDPRIGKFLSVDPLADEYPFYTPYQFAGNNPIRAVDLDGAEGVISMFLPNAFSEENTTKLKNNLGIKKGSFADKLVDFVSGVGNRSRELNNPVAVLKSGGDHLKNIYNNGKSIITAKDNKQRVNAALHLGFPSLNATEQIGQQTVDAIKTGDYRTMGFLFTDAASFAATLKIGMLKTQVKVDLMGGGTSKLGNSFLNYDLNATQGIRADVADFGKFFGKGTVSEIVVNNPQADFLLNVSNSIKEGGTIAIRGQVANKFFKKIWNGTAEGMEGFEVVPNSKKTGLSIEGYKKTFGEPLNGDINSLNEIILKKK